MTETKEYKGCKHEIAKTSLEYSKNYGRVGICKFCGRKMYATIITSNPKRTRPKMSKKERRKMNKLIRENRNG